jgi:hypothetical protein
VKGTVELDGTLEVLMLAILSRCSMIEAMDSCIRAFDKIGFDETRRNPTRGIMSMQRQNWAHGVLSSDTCPSASIR